MSEVVVMIYSGQVRSLMSSGSPLVRSVVDRSRSADSRNVSVPSVETCTYMSALYRTVSTAQNCQHHTELSALYRTVSTVQNCQHCKELSAL